MTPALDLPFKPFTLDEAHRISGAPSKAIDKWTGMEKDFIRPALPLKQGLGIMGLEWMQVFACLVGRHYLHEGCPPARTDETVRFIGSLTTKQLAEAFRDGRSFPAVRSMLPASFRGLGMLVECPKTNLGRRLDLKPLHEEFLQRMREEFPNG